MSPVVQTKITLISFRRLVVSTKTHRYEPWSMEQKRIPELFEYQLFWSRLWTPSPQLTPPNPHSSPCRLPEEICLYPAAVNAVQRVHWVRLSSFPLSFSVEGVIFLSFTSCIPDTNPSLFYILCKGSVNSEGQGRSSPLWVIFLQVEDVNMWKVLHAFIS